MLCGCAGFHSDELSNGTKMLICCSPSSSWCHTTHHHFWFLLHRAAFYFLHSGVCHLRPICLRYVLSSSLSSTPSICVSPLALAPIFAQIHRAASAPKPSEPSKACSSTSPSHSAPNPPASPCRPSKTGERPEYHRTDMQSALKRGFEKFRSERLWIVLIFIHNEY